MTARHLSAAEQRKIDRLMKEQRHDKLMDRLEQFLDGVMVPETVTRGVAVSDAGSPNKPPIKIDVPESITEVMEEMAIGGLITPLQMRKLSAAISPIIEENTKLKDERKERGEINY